MLDVKSEQIQQAKEFLGKISEITRRHPDRVALALHIDGIPLVDRFSQRPMRLRSVQKMIIALAYARKVASEPSLAAKMVEIAEVDKANPPYFDAGAHEAWKTTQGQATSIPMDKIAKGMMIQSSNACTQYMMDVLGIENINSIISEYDLKILPLSRTFDELNAPLHGNANDMVKLLENIATHEFPVVRSQFEQIAKHRLISANHGEAKGFGKGGSGLIQDLSAKHDLNYALCVTNQEGKRISVCLLTNNLDTQTNNYLEERLTAFMCEISCNKDMQQQYKLSLEQPSQPIRMPGQSVPNETWVEYILAQPSRLIASLVGH